MALPPRIEGVLRGRRRLPATGLAYPARRFIEREGASGRLLMVAAAIALAWANSPWSDAYGSVWGHEVTFDLGGLEVRESLRAWINDGLMTVFFFLVTLEVKRELIGGTLASRRTAAFPVAAALGGMLAPAAIYLSISLVTGAPARGWGVPIATDVAFVLAGLAFISPGAPPVMVTFLLTLAVVDDIGAIVVIAAFYSTSIDWAALGVVVVIVGIIVGMQRLGLRMRTLYATAAVALWLAVHESGVHATLAGVILAALTPASPSLELPEFQRRAPALMDRIQEDDPDQDAEPERALGELEELTSRTEAPLERLENAFQPWSGYVILPLFALANAGIRIDPGTLVASLTSHIALGVALALALGKPLGIVGGSWLARASGLAEPPDGLRWRHVVVVALLGGIGFTVSLFITNLAFADATAHEAKIGILAATLLALLAATIVRRGILRDAFD